MSRNTFGLSQALAWLLRGVSLGLLPALAFAAGTARRTAFSRHCPGGSRTDVAGYLLAVGPPPLRFEQVLPPPDLSTRPVPAAPPLPAAMAEIAAANLASAKPDPGSTPASAPGAVTTPAPGGAVAAPGDTPAKPPAEKESSPLVPDDANHEVRLEEILPYFQYPASGRPAPAGSGQPDSNRLPVSSAVYRQQ